MDNLTITVDKWPILGINLTLASVDNLPLVMDKSFSAEWNLNRCLARSVDITRRFFSICPPNCG